MKEHVVALLELLQEMKPLPVEQSRSAFEKQMLRVNKVLFRTSCGFFALLALLLATVLVWSELGESSTLGSVAFALWAMGSSFGMLWIGLEGMASLVTICVASRYLERRQLLEAAQDMNHVEVLMEKDACTLKLSKQWIVFELGRKRARLAFVFGSPEKVAIFSIAALGWSVWKAIPVPGLVQFPGLEWLVPLLQAALALLFGLSIGALIVRARIFRLSYQRDLLDMAISQLELAK